jgi:uncharacterized protein YceK
MRHIMISLLVSTLFLTACSSVPRQHYQLEQNANQYVGDNIQTVLKEWGTPNQAMHTREGSSYYVYLTNVDAGPVPLASSEDSPIVGPRGRTIGVPIPASMPGDSYGQLICTTTFKTNSATGKILWAKHQGSGCLGKWVNTTER